MQKIIHDEQNANILNKDRIHIIDFSYGLRLLHTALLQVQSSFKMLVFSSSQILLALILIYVNNALK